MNELLRDLREPHDEARARANWQRIQDRRTPRDRSRWRWAGGAALAAAALLLVYVVATRPSDSLSRADGQPCMGSIDEREVTLSDGSSIALDDATELEVLENDGERMRLWMRQGAADFDVTPGGPRRWTIETGQVSVEVLGTSFRVERLEASVRVSVTRGIVLVRGASVPDGLARLFAGDEISVPSAVHTTEAAEEATTASAAPVAIAEASTEAALVVPEPPVAVGETPAEPGPSADEATETEDGAATDGATIPPAPLPPVVGRTLADADALRRAGRLGAAQFVLQEIVDGGGSEAALAAFTLGRLEYEQLELPRDAASSFERAIRLGLPAPLLEDARARRVLALGEAGDWAAAEQARREYLEHHPAGRRRAEIEEFLEAE